MPRVRLHGFDLGSSRNARSIGDAVQRRRSPRRHALRAWGGLEWWTLTSLPGPVDFTLAAVFELDGPQQQEIVIDLAVVPREVPNGEGIIGRYQLVTVERDDYVDGAPLQMCWVSRVAFEAQQVGGWEFRIHEPNGELLTAVPFGIRLKA